MIHTPPYDRIIYSDASKEGWGAHSDGVRTNGRWTEEEWVENSEYINVLELTAAKFAIFSFCKTEIPTHVRIMIDNTTAVSYINHQGGHVSFACNELSREIWMWAEKHNTWVSAAHVPGLKNEKADGESRTFNDETEWSIPSELFRQLCANFGIPTMDMFASRINKKHDRYVSWRPDPHSFAVDAFSIPWGPDLIYCFPPFSMIWKTVSKIARDKVDSILIAPLWPTQSWYPYALQMIIDHPIVFPARYLFLPNKPTALHPLHENLWLMALKLSGQPLKNTTFLKTLNDMYKRLGEVVPGKGMKVSLPNGKNFVSKGTCIPYTLV